MVFAIEAGAGVLALVVVFAEVDLTPFLTLPFSFSDSFEFVGAPFGSMLRRSCNIVTVDEEHAEVDATAFFTLSACA